MPVPAMTPTFPTTGVSGHAGAIQIVRVLIGGRAFRGGAAFAAPVASHFVVISGVGDGIGMNLRVLFAHGHNSAALDVLAQHPGAVVVTWMARCEPHHQMWTASATGGQ